MALSDMIVYSDLIVTATMEAYTEQAEAFNAASGGTIVLDSQAMQGDFRQESMFAKIDSSAFRRVDRYASNDAVAATQLSQIEDVVVKIASGYGPVEFEPSQMTYLQKNPEEAIANISRTLAEAILDDQLNMAIGAGVAAIGNVAALTNDISATAGISQSALNNTHALFGDASMRLTAQVMNGATYHKLIGEALTNTNTLFQAGNVTIVNILNKRVIVTDSPSLYLSGTPNKAYVLNLVVGAIIVSDSGDLIVNIETSNGSQRLVTSFQSDSTYTMGLKGYAWDITNGGKSPLDAEILTGSNWDLYVSDNKNTAGALLISDADL